MKTLLIPITCLLWAISPAFGQPLENFEAGNLNAWTTLEGAPEVASDEVFAGGSALRMAVFPEGPTLLTHNTFNGAFGRYRVQFHCEGDLAGFDFYFQYQGPEDFYRVSCRPEGTDDPSLRLIRQQGGEEVVLSQVGASFVTGVWNELMVERSCDLAIRIYINGVEQLSVADDVIQSAGTLGLGARAQTTYADDLAFEPFRAEVAILGDTLLCYDPLVLETSGLFAAYEWSTGASSGRIAVDQPGPVWVEVTDAQGCKARDSVQVVTFCPGKFYAPNIFSPNFDGVNDAFQVFTQRPPGSFHLQVYNRWGELVFESQDEGQGWDGVHRGKPAPAGVYLWWCELDGFALRGTLNLVR
jgi:gliding motility-associated-like protein